MVFNFRLTGILGFEEKIAIKKLDNNPGIIPLKLGSARVEKYSHELIHFYDLNPIIEEINKLKNESLILQQLVETNEDYQFEISNYLKILKFAENRVDTKLSEILPQPQRTKRGLINALGSIFKSITGNLDYTDGERYDKLINQVQTNQIKLSKTIRTQNSLTVALIDKFNETVQQIRHNEKLLETRLRQISLFVETQTQRENANMITDVANQLINMFEIFISILQDIENSISFSMLQQMHPSIINTADLYVELLKIKQFLEKDEFPLKLNKNTMHLFIKYISIKSFIYGNKVVYVLRIPISFSESFKYYHLYPVPILTESQFQVIVPRNKYLIKNQLYFAYSNNPCKEIYPEHFFCANLDIEPLKANNPCEIQLLGMKDTSNCQKMPINLSGTMITRLENSNQWIITVPNEETFKLKCNSQNEVQRLIMGTYLFEVPVSCRFSSSKGTVTNIKFFVNQTQPMLFPDLVNKPSNQHKVPKNFMEIQLTEDMNLDDLKSIKTQMLNNQPFLSTETISYVPSVWTIACSCLMIIVVAYLIYKKMERSRCLPKSRSKPADKEAKDRFKIELADVQLPR